MQNGKEEQQIFTSLLFVLLITLLVGLIAIHIGQYWDEAVYLQERADIIGWDTDVGLFDHDDVVRDIDKWEAQYAEILILEKRAREIDWPLQLGGPPYSPDKLRTLARQIQRSEDLHPRVLILKRRAQEIGVTISTVDTYKAINRSLGPEVIRSFPYREESIERAEKYVEELEKIHQIVTDLKQDYGMDLLRLGQLNTIKEDALLIEQWRKDGLDLSNFDFVSVELEDWLSFRKMFAELKMSAGSVTMGCTPTLEEEQTCLPHEGPVQEVTISRAFYMMKTEVTQELYTEVMGENPTSYVRGSQKKEDFIDFEFPVSNIDWRDAVEFANRLSVQDGLEKCYTITENAGGYKIDWPKQLDCRGWRLPTEAEWVYAATANEEFVYPGSDSCIEVAWAGCRSGEQGVYPESNYVITGLHAPCQKKPNTFGLCDMAGNVEEWVWDQYQETYAPEPPLVDPIGPEASGYQDRLRKGGSWKSSPREILPVRRVFSDGDTVGIRLVRSVVQKPLE